jgi:hypothetical protein
MAAFEVGPSSVLSDHKVLQEAAAAEDFVFQQCFESNQQRGPEEPARAGEGRLEELLHPIVAPVEPRPRFGTPGDERLVA